MFNLTKLIEFNSALVYGFEPESSPKRLDGSETFEDALFPEAGQHQDMFNAYMYAQETILPQIARIGIPNINPEMLIDWVKSIHRLIGKSLLESYNNKSGEYTKEIVFRWHLGAELGIHFCLYFEGHEHKSSEQFASFVNKQFDMNYQAALDFITLLEKIANKDKYTIHESLQPFINYEGSFIKGILVFNKLATAYNLNQLSTNEKNIVDKILKICMFLPNIPDAMDQWAQDTVARLHSCNFRDLESASEFLAKSFYGLTEVHPFLNANGRTATCLMNIFLRAFGYPSIVLRRPGERDNNDSAYQKAFSEINSTINPLKELIYIRVKEAQGNAFANERLKELIVLRVGLSNLLQETKSKHPDFNISAFHKQILASNDVSFAMKMADSTQASIFALSKALARLAEVREQLDLIKQKKSILFIPSPLDSTQINEIIKCIEKISGQKGWKHSVKNGLVTWLELSNKEEAKEIVATLQSMEVAKVLLTQRVDNKKPVIKCEAIQYQKLIKAADELKEIKAMQGQNIM